MLCPFLFAQVLYTTSSTLLIDPTKVPKTSIRFKVTNENTELNVHARQIR